MSLFILDTDTLSLAQRGHARVSQQIIAHLTDDLTLTAITLEEQLEGWRTHLPQARQPQQIEAASRMLTDLLFPSWCQFRILPFIVPAVVRFEQLRRLRLNVGPMDLRIGAIALEAGATVVTRNQRDFGRIPGVTTVDWST